MLDEGVELTKSPEVERWFAKTKPPGEAAMRRLRDLILGGDRRMTEYVKNTGRAVRFLRFADVKGVNECAAEIKAIAKEWCDVRDANTLETRATTTARPQATSRSRRSTR
jgi:hypothetical protein